MGSRFVPTALLFLITVTSLACMSGGVEGTSDGGPGENPDTVPAPDGRPPDGRPPESDGGATPDGAPLGDDGGEAVPDSSPACGNGVIDPGEACDGSDLGGATCVTVGDFAGGALACAGDCTFDTLACTAPEDDALPLPQVADDTAGDQSNWHPGHYLFSSVSDYSKSKLQSWIDTYPKVRGIYLVYLWNEWEAALGVYDFSKVLGDLEWCHERGKRLIVMLKTKTWESAYGFPDYIRADPSLWFQINQPPGYNVVWWDDRIVDHTIPLVEALAAAIGRSPYRKAFEGFYIAENAPSAPDPGEAGDAPMNTTTYAQNMVTVLRAAKSAFAASFGEPKLVGQFTNYALARFGPPFIAEEIGFGRPNLFIETAASGSMQATIKSYVYPGIARGTVPPANTVAEVPLVVSPQMDSYGSTPDDAILTEARLMGAHHVAWMVAGGVDMERRLAIVEQHPKGDFLMLTRPASLSP